ncbi:NAD(P)H-dependent oxidoreductase [Companilactobacillus alimentarius]|uniref:NAD(P)H dehydrogenase n=1 Tax=Companilactobacillus alimentarius DSM 20249 TaxID=1423720 RepID=A0A2K9HES1_9LACO|nr:NAD(P)H-dependent oxidoreductase [Companilactobacillus alimentarius]AUI71061.1 NAD(P)H dehydrogenase [Companilactobacillus alimentarius DSM 20249]KRK75178.1 NAD(P)H oxidoreductase [Companilactobacillus alimentarius DSM 20249]MDT6951684.1 NAD(P)H-dependent oxidoreductase [Companilactobacillus alimentarius]GEO44045.1 NAD(P)H dehydrogenase [Companilactobacillus alimentarius]
MTTTIIYAHPYSKSFNNAILKKVSEKYKSDYRVIDLYKEEFNPVYSSNELSLFKYGETEDDKVEEYQKILKESSKLVFIFPIWWNGMPAILKGFIDKVFKMNFAYVDSPRGVEGLLTNIDSVDIVTSSKSPTWYLKFFSGNAIQKVFIKSTLKQAGIKNASWKNFGSIKKSTKKQREKFLKNL